jgi:hypothetical protein
LYEPSLNSLCSLRRKLKMANEQAAQQKQAEVRVSTQPKVEEQRVIKVQEKLKKWSQLVAHVWDDEQLKQRLVHNPAAVLRENGLEVPAGVEIRVVENTDKVHYLVLPPKPLDSASELTSEQIDAVVGGKLIELLVPLAIIGILIYPDPPEPKVLTGRYTK